MTTLYMVPRPFISPQTTSSLGCMHGGGIPTSRLTIVPKQQQPVTKLFHPQLYKMMWSRSSLKAASYIII